MAACIVFRIISNLSFPGQTIRNFSMTHLRIDSLLAGVLVSYWYNFKFDSLKNIFKKYTKYLLVISFGLLTFTPFIEPVPSFFVKTIGFSMLYLSFGILLIYFLVNENINGKLNSILTKPVIDAVSKIGFSSYSIYIIHTFVIRMVEAHGFDNKLLNFALSFLISILAGIGMTYSFEKYFLGLRDKYFPARVG